MLDELLLPLATDINDIRFITVVDGAKDHRSNRLVLCPALFRSELPEVRSLRSGRTRFTMALGPSKKNLNYIIARIRVH